MVTVSVFPFPNGVGFCIPERGRAKVPPIEGIGEYCGYRGMLPLALRPRLILPRIVSTIGTMAIHNSGPLRFLAGASDRVSFDRRELGVILSVYGRMVAAGEWRDYGISSLGEVAVFAVFRRTSELPLYRIEKRPRLRSRQGPYSVIGMDGRILGLGHDLRTVLRVLERKLIRTVQ